MSYTILVVILVYEHLWKSVDLWNQLSEICGRRYCVIPRPVIRVKYSISYIESSTLESDSSNTVRSDSDQEVEDNGRRAVVSAKMILIKELFLIFVVIFFHEISDSILISLHTHIFGEISKRFIILIYFIKSSNKRPWKYWILCYITITATCNLV